MYLVATHYRPPPLLGFFTDRIPGTRRQMTDTVTLYRGALKFHSSLRSVSLPMFGVTGGAGGGGREYFDLNEKPGHGDVLGRLIGYALNENCSS